MSRPHESDLECLERFVAENDELLELEERIGRFNVFDALGVARAEIRHSNFLAWLLDPNESHGQGDLFLKAVLMDIMRQARDQGVPTPISPVLLDSAELKGVEIRREWRHIDLLILCRDPSFVVAFENKVGSGERSGQLEKYQFSIRSEYPGYSSLHVFLTVDGEDASSDLWTAYSYSDIHRALSRARKQAKGALGTDVLVFLDHYLNLIGSRFMDDPNIKSLCQRIFANHRRAIELINQHTEASRDPLLIAFLDEVHARLPEVEIIETNAREVRLTPRSWLAELPPIGLRGDARGWLAFRFMVRESRCSLSVRTSKVTESEQRNRVLNALFGQGDDLGFKPSFKGWPTQARVMLRTERLATWKDDEEPDVGTIVTEAVSRIDRHIKRLAVVPELIRSALSG